MRTGMCCSPLITDSDKISWYLKMSWCVCRAAEAGFRSLVVQFLLREAAWHEPTDRGEVSVRRLFRMSQPQSSCSFILPVRQGGGFRCSDGDQRELCCQGDGDAASGEREQWCRKSCLLLNNAALGGGVGETDQWPTLGDGIMSHLLLFFPTFFFFGNPRFGCHTFLN